MANKTMKTLTVGENIYEVVDEAARNGVSNLNTLVGNTSVKSQIDSAIEHKADDEHTHTANEVGADPSGSAANALSSAKSYTDTKISDLINSAPTTLDTLGEIATAMKENDNVVSALDTAVGTKANASDLTSHTENKSNPHGVTLSQLGVTATADVINDFAAKSNAFVTPEMYGAVGDGITDDSDAFTNALLSGEKVVCDPSKNYYFANPIDCRTLSTGHLDGNYAVFTNFHIYININDDFNDWRVAYPFGRFTIENMVFAEDDGWNKLPRGWETPLITTGAPMIIRNITCSYPYLLATVDEYIDYMLLDCCLSSLNESVFNGSEWLLDGISCLNKNGQYERFTNSNNGAAGDSWVIRQCNEFSSRNNSEYRMMRITARSPIVIESCVQSSFDVGRYGKAIFNGCHWEDRSKVTFSSTYQNTVVFNNCYFYSNHTLNNHRLTTYQNCFFRTTSDARLVSNHSLAEVLGNVSFYDIKCNLVNCCFGENSCINTEELKRKKYLPKKTYNFSTINNRVKLNTLTPAVNAGNNEYNVFPETGNYSYEVYLRATSLPDIAIDYAQYNVTIDDVTKYMQIPIAYTNGGFSIVVIRTSPSGVIKVSEYYCDPNETDNPTDYLRIMFQDYGTYSYYGTGGTYSPGTPCPWVEVDTKPTLTVKERLYEANGVLVTADGTNSELSIGGSLQTVPFSSFIELQELVTELQYKLYDHVQFITGAKWSREAQYEIDESTGEVISGYDYVTEELIPVTPGCYAYYDDDGEYSSKQVAIYKSDGTFIRKLSYGTTGILYVDIAEWEDAAYVRLVANGTSTRVPSEVMKFDNIGVWGAYGYYGKSTSTGIITTRGGSDAATLAYIPVEGGATYKHANSATGKQTTYKSFLEYDADKNFIKFTSGGNTTNANTVTVTANTAYVLLVSGGFASHSSFAAADGKVVNESFVFEKV